MLASLDEPPLEGDGLAFEPKYDGVRALIELERRGPVVIWSRRGNDKTSQFPDLARALTRFSEKLKAGVLLDGEIVAVDESGEPAGFQRLQGRLHLTGAEPERRAGSQPVAFIAFDVLRDGGDDLRALPLTARRARLERIFGNTGSSMLRLSELVPADGRTLHAKALARGLEGLIVKDLESRYLSGRRSPAWRKLKLMRREEFVVGGWTAPRRSRQFFGALLLGRERGDALEYVGHVGVGFTDAELGRVAEKLRRLETPACPFRPRPKTNEPPRWVTPALVAEVAFGEWTEGRKLRHPKYLGLRDDVDPRTITRAGGPDTRAKVRHSHGEHVKPPANRTSRRHDPPATDWQAVRWVGSVEKRLIRRLEAIEENGGHGTLDLPEGALEVTNLKKTFWPELRISKGELLRYYVAVSRLILPVIADRPLVMKRYPNGVTGKAFYQQRAPAEVPRGVRVESLRSDTIVPSRLIGGSLLTLLYMTQIAAISQDPFFSRVQSLDDADHVAFDLDPMPGVTFERVLDVARWIHDELERLHVPSVPKTSGSEGLHIYVPLARGTSYDAGRLFCELVADGVARKHPKIATVERTVNLRGRTVYIDCLQNIRGKTLATAYSARANDFAGVSTPLTWDEVHGGIDRNAFTLRALAARVASTGDLWAALRTARGVDLHRVVERPGGAARAGGAARGAPARPASRRRRSAPPARAR